jgi:hypothetical protein
LAIGFVVPVEDDEELGLSPLPDDEDEVEVDEDSLAPLSEEEDELFASLLARLSVR